MAAALSGAVSAAPVQWTAASGGNDHFYEFVSGSFTWIGARDAAAGASFSGMTGYLATITSQAENDFIVNSVSNTVGWAGGSDDPSQGASEGTWKWITGPEAGQTFYVAGASPQPGYSNWSTGEPNNLSCPSCDPDNATENYLQINANPNWNDTIRDNPQGYFVEYGANVAPVPVPAALPLLGSALAALGLLRRRRADA